MAVGTFVTTTERRAMTFAGCLRLIQSDLRRYRATGASSSLKVVLTNQGFWASASFRISSYVYSRFRRVPILGLVVALFATIQLKAIQILTGISIPVGTSVGSGLYIGHQDGIVVSGKAIIGSNCNLATQVVIGIGRKDGKFGVPCLGDRVFVGPGAKLLGPIRIGNDVAIGANAVVTSDVADRAVVVGIPAYIISYRGSFDYVHYDGMEQDPDRTASLAKVSGIYEADTGFE
jgi:serine O-acetyltransferase